MVEEKEKEAIKKESPEVKKSGFPTVLVVIVVILVGLALIGNFVYKKIAERTAEGILSGLTGGKVDVKDGGEKLTFKTEDGELSFEEGGKLPESFPKDFPIYPGAKQTSSFTADNEKGKGVSVIWETSDSADKVSEFYKTELAKGNWKVSASYESEGTSTLTFEKGEDGGFLGINSEESKTTISVTISVK